MKTRLLSPFFYNLRHRFTGSKQRVRTTALLGIGLVLIIGIYLISARTLLFFYSQNELGVILSLKIMQMAWVITFTMLLFSMMVSGVSAVFLSQDNEIMVAAPLEPQELFAMRYITTTVFTSWMMVIFSLPVFAAFGTVFQAGWAFWPLLLLAVLSTTATAAAMGLALVIVLVNVFPAKRTKDIVLYLSLLFGILLYLVIRLIKPEELANPDRFADFIDYLGAISTPASPLLPPSWAANLLTLYLRCLSLIHI